VIAAGRRNTEIDAEEVREDTWARRLHCRFIMKRSTRPTILRVLLGLTICGGLACSGGSTATLGNGDSGRTITVSGGDELEVTLGSIGNQGEPSVSSAAIRFDGKSLVGAPNPGGPTFRYRFAAVSRGEATITIPFLNPNNSPPFTVHVNVR
jgi:hypothetical protein